MDARFELLSNTRPRLDTFGASIVAQCILVVILVGLPLFLPEQFNPVLRYNVIPIAAPLTEVLLPPPPPKVRPKIEPPIPKVEEPPKVAKLLAPKPVFPVAPKPKPVEVKTPELKPTEFDAPKLDVKSTQPARPREPVQVNNLSTGSAAPATVKAPLSKVQTGGFGDPNGLPGPGDPSKRANINQKGSPSLPGGPGYGNGTGGAKGIRGTVASTGFGNGTANPPGGGGGGSRQGAVKQGGFSDASAPVAEAPKKKVNPNDTATTTVVILDKPRPEYTEEARKLKIEGDVVVEVVFLASGQMQVNRVVSGLGHGLDQSALRAAQQIKFKPARNESQPVDFPARVRIEFRMAY